MSDLVRDTEELMDTMFKIDPNHVMESNLFDDSSNEWFKQDSPKKSSHDDELFSWLDLDYIDSSLTGDEEKSNNITMNFDNVKNNHDDFIVDENYNKSNCLQSSSDTDCIDFSTTNKEKKSNKVIFIFKFNEGSRDFVLIEKNKKKSTNLKKPTNRKNGNFLNKECHTSLSVKKKSPSTKKSSKRVKVFKLPKSKIDFENGRPPLPEKRNFHIRSTSLNNAKDQNEVDENIDVNKPTKFRNILPPKKNKSLSFGYKPNENLTPFNVGINQTNSNYNNVSKMSTVNVERKYLCESQRGNKDTNVPTRNFSTFKCVN